MPTPCEGSVLHVYAQWVTPSPVPAGIAGQSLKGRLLWNITKLVRNQATERCEINLIIPTTWYRDCTTCPCPMSYPSPVSRGAIG